ncbi:hypothetical protein Plhal304r1_c002g0007071 [Plasmopara halstedii]
MEGLRDDACGSQQIDPGLLCMCRLLMKATVTAWWSFLNNNGLHVNDTLARGWTAVASVASATTATAGGECTTKTPTKVVATRNWNAHDIVEDVVAVTVR